MLHAASLAAASLRLSAECRPDKHMLADGPARKPGSQLSCLGVCSQSPHASQTAQEHGGTDPAYGAEVEGAIQAAFLDGTDEDFQELLEVIYHPVDLV